MADTNSVLASRHNPESPASYSVHNARVRTLALLAAAAGACVLAIFALLLASSEAASLAAPEVSCGPAPHRPVGQTILNPRRLQNPVADAWCAPPTSTPLPWPTSPPTPTVLPDQDAIATPPARLAFVDATATPQSQSGELPVPATPAPVPSPTPATQPPTEPTSQPTPAANVAEPTAQPSNRVSPVEAGAAVIGDPELGDTELGATEDTGDAALEETPTAAATVDELAAWIEAQAGRTFTSPALVNFQRSNPVTHEAVENAISVDAWNLWLTLGLIDASDSRRVAGTAWLESGRGSCCPAAVLIGDDDFETTFVTVHELAHALDWERIERQPSQQVIPALLAVVEGNAHRLAIMWATESGADTAAIEAAASIFDEDQASLVPPAVRRILTYPYDEGLRFIEAIHDQGGESAILEAFDRPPNGAEVLNPQRWLEPREWTDVAMPVDLLDSAPSTGGELGAFILSLMIEPHVGQAQAHDLVDSWLGDSYVVSNTIEQSCLAARVVMQHQDGAAALGTALRLTGGFVDTAGTTINFTRCT